MAAQVLSEVDAVAVWKKSILQQNKPQVILGALQYLTDRVFGRRAQLYQALVNRLRLSSAGVAPHRNGCHRSR